MGRQGGRVGQAGRLLPAAERAEQDQIARLRQYGHRSENAVVFGQFGRHEIGPAGIDHQRGIGMSGHERGHLGRLVQVGDRCVGRQATRIEGGARRGAVGRDWPIEAVCGQTGEQMSGATGVPEARRSEGHQERHGAARGRGPGDRRGPPRGECLTGPGEEPAGQRHQTDEAQPFAAGCQVVDRKREADAEADAGRDQETPGQPHPAVGDSIGRADPVGHEQPDRAGQGGVGGPDVAGEFGARQREGHDPGGQPGDHQPHSSGRR